MAKTAKVKKTRRTMVWHVANWMDWYEPQENVRKKVDAQRYWMFRIRAYDMDSTAAIRARSEILSEYGPEVWVAYEDILCEAGKLDWKHRGYLLDSQMRPATLKMIAGWINKPVKKTEKILEQLKKSLVLANVPMPDFSKDDVNRRNTKTSDETADAPPPEPGRNETGMESPPLNNGKGKSRPSASVNEEEENKVGLSASEGEGQAEGKGTAAAAPSRSAEGQSPPTADAVDKPKAEEQAEPGGDQESQAAAGTETDAAIPPTATPPIADVPTEPTETDGGRQDGNLNRLYDTRAVEFSGHVYRLIGIQHSLTSPAAAREMAAFASKWQDAIAELAKPSLLTEAWNGGMKHAKQIGKNYRNRPEVFTKGPGAVWCKKFNGLIAKLKAG